mmetsp:Transcript_39272/g.59950  ORF Transcript_39272/g.59950 Transcript_39272/m.59950 type:complete len:134 (-) Transcript_39272:2058-2459(-)
MSTASFAEVLMLVLFLINAITFYQVQKNDALLFQGLLAIQAFVTVACVTTLLIIDPDEVDLDKKEEEYAVFIIGIVPSVPYILTNAGFASALTDRFAIKVGLNAGTLMFSIGLILGRTAWVLLLDSGTKYMIL